VFLEEELAYRDVKVLIKVVSESHSTETLLTLNCFRSDQVLAKVCLEWDKEVLKVAHAHIVAFDQWLDHFEH
jgi:hypothetical protein